ncbi:MAG: outer membrane efflux protein [Bacteroidetes bacterium]|nr:MAG: outer membrane efflux protein [Bacteroidota bacterium]
MIKKLFFLLPFFFLFVRIVPAQGLLTAEDALATGLKNNFDLQISRGEASVDSVNNSPGAAGMLPSVTLNGSASFDKNDGIHQRFSNGNDIFSANSTSSNLSSSIALSWTLFDGTKMFVTKQRLEQMQVQGMYEFKARVNSVSKDILLAYYDVVQQKKLLKALDEIIALGKERVLISETRLAAGLAPKTDLLQAKIDLNLQQENRIAQEQALGTARRKLNSLLARDILAVFDVSDSIPAGVLSDRKALEQKMLASNPDLAAFKLELDIAKLSLREARTGYLPRLDLLGGYNFSHTENSAGFSLLSQNYGWQGGLTLSVPLYSAGTNRRNVRIAQIGEQTAEARFAQARLTASLRLHDALDNFDSRLRMLQLEKENETLARENVRIALDRLRLGQGTSIEVRQAESTLAEVLSRLVRVQYELKSAELAVKAEAVEL